jgi:hypothetical protein
LPIHFSIPELFLFAAMRFDVINLKARCCFSVAKTQTHHGLEICGPHAAQRKFTKEQRPRFLPVPSVATLAGISAAFICEPT